jgi:hypothetical protein
VLIGQGWLTAFQVNLVLQGRGRELLLGPYLRLGHEATVSRQVTWVRVDSRVTAER